MKKTNVIIVLSIMAVATFLVAPFIGEMDISFKIFPSFKDTTEYMVFWDLRFPRVITSFMVGIGLGLAGLIFQALFANPLTTPYTLGVSNGAALGAAIYINLGLTFAIGPFSGITLVSFAAALLTIFLVYHVASLKGNKSISTLLLAGIAIGLTFSGLLLFIQYLGDQQSSLKIIRWLMGGLEVIGFQVPLNMAPFVLLGVMATIYHTRELNLLTLGEDLAQTKGVNNLKIRKRLFLISSLMVGGIISQCGPVTFVGLIVPHIGRLLVGHNHNCLVVVTILFGGTFLTICDLLSQIILRDAQLPVGIITTMLGGPFFLYLLLSNKNQGQSIFD